ncbi:UNVERIFIED_CONTAM: Retrovirus-related Pol polyprotein from transposon RE2 [Sesamum radiatum]|uniref:Retrovirus-related Pol polyprotein from transposon RE2 n=1 Tax=Sesamum radiatum TaxID=300843 RepID=A0AAW2TTA2_SESRA
MQETEANVAYDRNDSQQPTWEACLSIKVLDQPTSVTSAVHQDDVPADIRASINYSEEWIVDSGCSHHTTGNDDLLSNIRPYHEKKVIVTADNSLHPMMKEGDLNDRGIFLKDVYHVPGLKKNLASVSQITDSGRKESLYVLSASDEYVKRTGKNESSILWHARLDHVGFQLLQKISTDNLLDGVPNFKNIQRGEICSGCQYEKSHRFPFSYSRNRASAALQFFHSDLLGPTRTSSYTGLTYVMVIVDDFSRFSWVYLLEHKSGAFSKFIRFKHDVEKEFGSQIKCLGTNNGREFISNDFMGYYREHGIQRQMTCPETPQQNGVAE